jgi:hypothetical protein
MRKYIVEIFFVAYDKKCKEVIHLSQETRPTKNEVESLAIQVVTNIVRTAYIQEVKLFGVVEEIIYTY